MDVIAPRTNEGLCAISIDIKDLYYSLPRNALLECVKGALVQFGWIDFKDASGISSRHLDLLATYLDSTYILWDGKPFIQKQGICIGSCIAPILSDLFLGSLNRTLLTHLTGTSVFKCFRYVDDYLYLMNCDKGSFESEVSNLLTLVRDCLQPLQLTHEVSGENGSLKFYSHDTHTCWLYDPRGNKPLLPFASSHSKLVKRSIVRHCLDNAISKSCRHLMATSLDCQKARLAQAGYPDHLLVSVAESLLKKYSGRQQNAAAVAISQKRFAVMPYLHKISHNLKKVGARANIGVAFTAPNKLGKLCRLL